MLAFTLIGIAARSLPAAVALVKADLAAAKTADSPHGAVVGVDEVFGLAYHLGTLLAEQFAPAIARAHGVTLPLVAAPLQVPAVLTITPGEPRIRPAATPAIVVVESVPVAESAPLTPADG